MKYSTITYGLAWLIWAVGMAGCELADPREGLETSEVIQLSVSQPEVLADGRSRVVLTATLGPAVNGNQSVTFGTDQGVFDGSGAAGSDLIQVNSSGREARATLLTNTQPNEQVTLTASIEANGQAFTDFAEVAFVPALPQLLSLRVTALQLRTSDETTLEVSLFRDEGAVSEGRRIDLSAAPVGGSAAEAVVPDFIFSENGVASAVIQSRNDSTGMVRLTARTPAANGGELSQSIDITFVD